jgi:hypothetical protein
MKKVFHDAATAYDTLPAHLDIIFLIKFQRQQIAPVVKRVRLA